VFRSEDPDVASDVAVEALSYRRRFLLIVMISGGFACAAFVVAAITGLNSLSPEHFLASSLFSIFAFALSLILGRRPGLYMPVCVAYAIATFLLFLSALFFVPDDELRVLWFFLHTAGAFVLLGSGIGWLSLIATIVIVVTANAFGLIHYSSHAIVTLSMLLVTAGGIFHSANRQAAAYSSAIGAANQELARLSRHDPLTGLFNSRAFAEAWIKVAHSEVADQPVSLLFLDIDRFKTINDTYGHAFGDVVLQTVAGRLGRAVRPGDSVGRIGGEEICILLPATDREEALTVAETVRTAIAATPASVRGKSIVVTVSIGVATGYPPHEGIETLQHAADLAMFEAKRAGRNRVMAAA
jgi:diguanylate cyclase (GGDEF)-like protein